MNETGSYPGQPWLWLYTLWYQVPGFTNSANVDMIAIYLTGLATMLLLFIPFVPGLRDIPAGSSRCTASSGGSPATHVWRPVPIPIPLPVPAEGPTTSAPPDRAHCGSCLFRYLDQPRPVTEAGRTRTMRPCGRALAGPGPGLVCSGAAPAMMAV